MCAVLITAGQTNVIFAVSRCKKMLYALQVLSRRCSKLLRSLAHKHVLVLLPAHSCCHLLRNITPTPPCIASATALQPPNHRLAGGKSSQGSAARHSQLTGTLPVTAVQGTLCPVSLAAFYRLP